MSTIYKDLGPVTAYAYAVAGGYVGTEAQFEALLGNIAEDLSNIENLTVTVTTLPAGSSATASYADGVLSLGIPKGDTGEQGEQGEQGDEGVGIGAVTKTGTSGNVDTYTVYSNEDTPSTIGTFDVTNGSVTSVNTKTGAVTISAADLGAATSDEVRDITNCEHIPYTEENAYIDLSGSTVTMEDGAPKKTGSSASFSYSLLACVENDQFTVTGEGGSQTRLWGFVSSTGTILSKSDASIARTNIIITAPAGSAWLILHSKNTARSYSGVKPGILISELQANEQMYDSIFADVVPSSILGLVDLNIYNANYIDYEKYRLHSIRHNSSWHLQMDVQGYKNNAWSLIDSVEVAASSAPSPIPTVEYFDSKYHRFTATVVWNMMGSSISLSTLEYEFKNRVVNRTQIGLRTDVNKALSRANIPPFELQDFVDRAKVVTVKKDGTGDYTSIGAAYSAITDSAFDNQYEIIVYPGTYNENNLVPPAYSHTHGLFPFLTIVDSTGTGAGEVDNSVFDQQYAPSKLSNMHIKSATKYCVHQDVELYADALVNENLICEKLAGGSSISNACVGMGADFGGAKFIWKNCTFINNEVGMHTNPNADPNANQHLIFENCKFINAYLWLGVAGNTYGNYVCEINNCIANEGNPAFRLKFGSPLTGIPVNFPWHITGGHNNLAPYFDNANDTSVDDAWNSINTADKIYVMASQNITKGKLVTYSGTIANSSTEACDVAGFAVADTTSGSYVPVWKSAVISTNPNGQYGPDASGDLSASASNKTGKIINNVYYPFIV